MVVGILVPCPVWFMQGKANSKETVNSVRTSLYIDKKKRN